MSSLGTKEDTFLNSYWEVTRKDNEWVHLSSFLLRDKSNDVNIHLHSKNYQKNIGSERKESGTQACLKYYFLRHTFWVLSYTDMP